MPSTIIPALMYRDAPAAIEWLCEVFGFRRHLVVPGKGESILHAQLTLGDGMVMVSSLSSGPAAFMFTQPDISGGRETQTPCLVVQDADAVYAKVRAGGGKILLDIKYASYGGRGFSCADPEGHIWHVGTYDPWADPQQPQGR